VSCGLLPLLAPSKPYYALAFIFPKVHCLRASCFHRSRVAMARVKSTLTPWDGALVEEDGGDVNVERALSGEGHGDNG
jgi:hypothetical protein